ncbi:MAG: cupin domain-containing protein [Candidatus Woesearchaeota archaeon]|nr:MAG: cupin domain-containing protein [Candidatus Woesearchaeota archaeon]
MIVKKNSRIEHENSKKCIAYEYPMGDKDINVALIKINGRYPNEGEVTNEVVKELSFVAKGFGKVVIDKKEYTLEEGDAILILPKQKYFFEGDLELVISCNPAWYPEQHKQV